MAPSRGLTGRSAALAALLALCPAPALAAERLVIPFEINDLDHMVVRIEINGTGGTTAVIDTAATFPMLDSRTASSSGVPAPGADPRRVNVLGLNGAREYPVVRVDEIRLGNLNLASLDAAYSEDLDVPGAAANVLPSTAFPGDILELDFSRRVISVYDGRPDRPETDVSGRINYTVLDGLMFVDVRINGKPGRAIVDTGSNISYVNSAFAGLAQMRTNEEKSQLLLGATGGDARVRVATARKMSLGDFYFSGADIMVSDPFLFESLGVSDEPAMVLGLDYLSLFTVQFDRRQNRMVLSLPATKRKGMLVNLNPRGSRIQ
ncbi:aspartyl protease family protein [Hyphomonas sp.]|uniref:aspartyl protease family protein n=1 Tax=Hyphomonas sp. TaxID=87 RepID=UPI0025B9177F|nr:aspartyl protease family protein [Hyphomonas sp.]